MTAYYNEHDPYAAQWLRNLVAAGHIAPGEVDERSILDVAPDDLRGFAQCHFFAGIGVWSYALRLAGWPDERPVWTGSCPCQPFSVAGVGGGFDDERHLWPFWFWLIEKCTPPIVFGEQVEAAIRHGWLDLVQADMEGIGYAFAAAGIPAAGVGAPHIRQRLWFVADASPAGLAGFGWGGRTGARHEGPYPHEHHEGDVVLEFPSVGACPGEQRRRPTLGSKDSGRMGNDDDDEGLPASEQQELRGEGWREEGRAAGESGSSFWADCDWLLCRDGKARPVEPGTFPLAHGAAARVGRLRAYGNAIVPQVAAEVIRAYMECRP